MPNNPECFGCFPHEVPPMMEECYKNCKGSIILCKKATHYKEEINSNSIQGQLRWDFVHKEYLIDSNFLNRFLDKFSTKKVKITVEEI